MRRAAAVLTALAIAILALTGSASMYLIPAPAFAQSKSIPVKNALVVLIKQDNVALKSMLQQAGAPAEVGRSISLAETLLSSSVPRASTTGNGTFAIPAPADIGTYDVAVSAPGYVEAATGIAGTGSIVNVGSGLQQDANLTMVVQPSAVLSGRVTDSSGNPLRGIIVSAGAEPDSANYDVTTDDGVFVLDTGLRTGQYVIHAFRPDNNLPRLAQALFQSGAATYASLGGEALGALNETGSQSAYNPLGNYSQAANSTGHGYAPYQRTVNLAQGKLTTLNIQLDDSQAISGTVRSKGDSVPLPGIGIFAFNSSSGALASATVTDSLGHYKFDNGLAPGSYVIAVPAPASKYYAPESIPITLPSIDHSHVDLALDYSKEIRGRVIDSSGKGIGGATVVAASLGAGTPQSSMLSQLGAGTCIAVTGPDGAFLMNSGIAPGRYRLSAYYGDAIPVASSAIVTAGDSSVLLRMSYYDTVSISGTVTDPSGRPVAGARVLPSFAASIPGSDGFASLTGRNGTFSLKVPITDPSARSLFDQVIVSARGYGSAVANLTGTLTASDNSAGASFSNVRVTLSSPSGPQLSGKVVTQASDSPPLAAAVTRKGSFLVAANASFSETVAFKTNTRVVGASFDPQAKSLAVNFEGMQGPGGRTELSIPRNIMAGPFAVVLDGIRLSANNVTTAQNATFSTVAFEHDHGLSHAIIDQDSSQKIPEFPVTGGLIATVALFAAIPAAAIFKRKSRF